jgi:hypothetical protein
MTCERARRPFFGRLDRNAKILCIDDIGRHLANHDRWMGFGKSVALHHDRRSRLSVIARRRDDNDIATPHCPLASGASNSETASIQLRASSSWLLLRRLTWAATRFRTDANRASGTKRRNSRNPRRRRSRIIRIRSAVALTSQRQLALQKRGPREKIVTDQDQRQRQLTFDP